MPEDPIVRTVEIEDELSRSYVNYAMSVIVARALPDVRDGLKPVQRRILYSMRELNLAPSNPTTKCAKVTGETTANYHPHGNEVVYPTLVRMAQSFSMRYPLVEGQGNFGSIDGDPPAAMRYTECRLTPLAMELMEDLERETIEWTDNYLQSTMEPTVFPAKFPNLLCNGSQGIAVGMATSMPPHNLTEVANAILFRIANPQSTLPEVMEYLPGPDFPTHGLIMGVKGIKDAYETGRGSVVMQAKTMIEPLDNGKTAIIITEIPYQVNKSNLVAAIATLAKQKKFDGITAVEDYSDKRGMRIQVDLRRDVNPNKALNYLLKHTQLRTTFGCIMLSLVDGAPRVSPLLTLIDEYIKHRRIVTERRVRYDLYRALEDVHLNEGYQIARRNLDRIIRTIRESSDPAEARVRLIREFDMSALQANAILAMPLRRLTQLEQTELEARYKEALRTAQDLMDILANEARMTAVISEDITKMRDKHGDERRTRIIEREAGDFSEEDLIPEEEAIISISRDGYIKRISLDAYRQQKRGGKGLKTVTKEDDEPAHLFQVNTHHFVLFFTDRGRVFKLRAYDLPESTRYSRGMPLINYIAMDGGERVTAAVSVKNIKADGYLTMITRKGEIKRTAMEKFSNIRSNGLKAFDIDKGDELGWVLVTRGEDDIILVAQLGLSIRFNETLARDRGRTAGGVRAMRLGDDDILVGADIVREGSTLLVVGTNGFGKRTNLDDYRTQGRGGKGILTMNVTDKTGVIVSAEVVDEDDRLLVLTAKGKGIRVKVKDIRLVGRVAQGVKLINMQDGDFISSIARIIQDPDEGDVAGESEGEASEVIETTDES